jgi:hypothetical protein
MTTKAGVFKSENVLDRNFEGPFNSSVAQDILRRPNLELGRRGRFRRCSDTGFRSVEGAEIWVNDLYDDNNRMMFKHKTG